ncbi:MAG: cytochrome c [Bacteroidetes bacterium]|nr:cytochrome c [Bacteroidota bacterium]
MLGTYGSTTGQDGAWTAPDWAKNTKNPIEPSPASLAQGQRIFQQNCWTCHGKLGQGDGPAGAGLPTKPANLSSNAIQSQSDGEIFWKITEGRGTMAPYKQGLSETQRWHLVNYIRNLSN